jgi:hypothetical protein
MIDVTTPAGRAELLRLADAAAIDGCSDEEFADFLAAIRRLVERLDAAEATAARRLSLLRPFAAQVVHDRPNYGKGWPFYDALCDSAEHANPELNVGHIRAAAAEVRAAALPVLFPRGGGV